MQKGFSSLVILVVILVILIAGFALLNLTRILNPMRTLPMELPPLQVPSPAASDKVL